jgi:hypothetical protein
MHDVRGRVAVRWRGRDWSKYRVRLMQTARRRSFCTVPSCFQHLALIWRSAASRAETDEVLRCMHTTTNMHTHTTSIISFVITLEDAVMALILTWLQEPAQKCSSTKICKIL